jgi:D-alanyl-D-alanine carboxypeptidase
VSCSRGLASPLTVEHGTLRLLDARLEASLRVLLAAGAPGALALAVGPRHHLCFALGLESSGRPLHETARFNVGSVTKTFIAALVLAFVDDGLLGLGDDVTPHLSGRFVLKDSVTVRSLLNHTSGLPDYFENDAIASSWRENPSREWDPDELIEIALARPWHKIGIFNYANSNYLLIGRMIESMTGYPVSEALRRRISDPLGLSATRLPTTSNAAGGLVSTAGDLARFLAALLRGEIISQSSMREMLTTVPSDWAESQAYGLGIERVESLMGFEPSRCGPAWGHVGLGEATTVAFTTPDAKRQVVLMANAMLTNDAAWSALSAATWAVLCSAP